MKLEEAIEAFEGRRFDCWGNYGILRTLQKNDPSKKFTLKSSPNLNHLFQKCEKGTVQEYGQIEQTLSLIVIEDISAWINALFSN